MAITTPSQDLHHLLRHLAVAPSDALCRRAFDRFRDRLPSEEALRAITVDSCFVQALRHARIRVALMDDAPGELKLLMERLHRRVFSSLPFCSSLVSHLQTLLGPGCLDRSEFDMWVSAIDAQVASAEPMLEDLQSIITPDWTASNSAGLQALQMRPLESLGLFYGVFCKTQSFARSYTVWKDSGLLGYMSDLSQAIKDAKEGTLRAPTGEELLALQASRGKRYIPVGYAKEFLTFLQFLVIDCVDGEWRLRLLTADATHLQALTGKRRARCPEVIWKGVSLDALVDPDLWKVLLEPATLTGQELADQRGGWDDESFLLFGARHLIPWLSRRLNCIPISANFSFDEETWERYEANNFRDIQQIVGRERLSEERLPDSSKEILLKSTGKSQKALRFKIGMAKVAGLLPMDCLEDPNDLHLFKAEARLKLLICALTCFRRGQIAPACRTSYLSTLFLGQGMVLAPLEKALRNAPSSAQREHAKLLLATAAEYQQRLDLARQEVMPRPLEAPRSLYPTCRMPFRVRFPSMTFAPMTLPLLQTLPLGQPKSSFPQRKRWGVTELGGLHEHLESWYRTLLDATTKCEPSEVLVMGYREVLAQLPIPQGEAVESLFPEPISEGLTVGTLRSLRSICSLLMAEAYEEPFISPHFVIGMSRAYRFALELYRRLNPQVRSMPVSWYYLSEYANQRHSMHLPGDLQIALERLLASFAAISPEGFQRTDQFAEKEIPLFDFTWGLLPITYHFHRKELGPLRVKNQSVEQILFSAELADRVGIQPVDGATYDKDSVKWQNSFAGQALLAVQEISHFHALTVVFNTDQFQRMVDADRYRENYLVESSGPDDHFAVPAPAFYSLTEHQNRDGSPSENGYRENLQEGAVSFAQRMVAINDEGIRKPLSDLPVRTLEEFRSQADLLKSLPRRGALQRGYSLHQAASGPRSVSIETLLEYFESRANQLLSRDFRGYFSGVLFSGDVLQKASEMDPLLLSRLCSFLKRLADEDVRELKETKLHLDRCLWVLSTLRKVLPLHPTHCSALLLEIGSSLKAACESDEEAILAPHLLATNHRVDGQLLPDIVELARLHLLMGQFPPSDPNDHTVTLEALEAMQCRSHDIVHAMRAGDTPTRRGLWSLVLDSEADREKALSYPPSDLDASEVHQVAHRSLCAARRTRHAEEWQAFLKRYSYRDDAWKQEALARELALSVVTRERLDRDYQHEAVQLRTWLSHKVAYSQGNVVVRLGDRTVHVDWRGGRIFGGVPKIGSRLPVHLRRSEKLLPLKGLRRRRIQPTGISNEVRFCAVKGLPVYLDIVSGDVWTLYSAGGRERRFYLLDANTAGQVELPAALQGTFVAWVAKDRSSPVRALLTASDVDGEPVPAYRVLHDGRVQPVDTDTELCLSHAESHPEAEMFGAWGVPQDRILCWLDPENQLAEMHVPLSIEDESFVRVIRSPDGRWSVHGTDLYLKSGTESTSLFSGHSVYLTAENSAGERFLLLAGAAPQELKKRVDTQSHDVCWREIMVHGAEERIHQFRVLQSGQVEGMSVADNLLLMLWTYHLKQYERTIAIAKRWLTPAGRTYTDHEQKLLLHWLGVRYGSRSLTRDQHPSAAIVRLFVFVRMMRHLGEFPPEREEGKKMPKLWRAFHGSRMDRYEAACELIERSLHAGIFDRSFDRVSLQYLLSAYDMESLARSLEKWLDTYQNELLAMLSQELDDSDESQEPDRIALEMSFALEGAAQHISDDWGKIHLDAVVRGYPSTAQTKPLPVEFLKRHTVLPNILGYFDRAYTLLRDGPKDAGEAEEFEALVYAIEGLRGERMQSLCFGLYRWRLGYAHSTYSEEVMISWLVLEQVYRFLRDGHSGVELPPLPSVDRRFGLVLGGSLAASQTFFKTLIQLNGEDVNELVRGLGRELFAQRRVKQLRQEIPEAKVDKERKKSLKAPVPSLLAAALEEWKALDQEDADQVPTRVEVSLDEPHCSGLGRWTDLPSSKAERMTLHEQVTKEISTVREKLSAAKASLLAAANALPRENEGLRLAELSRQLHLGPPITVDMCIGLALRADEMGWKKFCSNGDPVQLQRKTLRYLELATEAQHLDRLGRQLAECMEAPSDVDLRRQARETLLTERSYTPSTASVALMASEYYSDMRLRRDPDQYRLITELSQVEAERSAAAASSSAAAAEPLPPVGSVQQAIMGSGKSKKVGPCQLQMMLGKGKIPILCVPPALFRTTTSDLEDMMWRRFQTRVMTLTFSREKSDLQQLVRLAEKLKLAQDEPTVFVARPSDLYALGLTLAERHQTVEEMRSRLIRFAKQWVINAVGEEESWGLCEALTDNDWDEVEYLMPCEHSEQFERWMDAHENLEKELATLLDEADLLQAVLNLLQVKGSLLVDEAANVFFPLNQMSFPIGWQEPANPEAAVVAGKVYFEWLPKHYQRLRLLENDQSMVKNKDREDITSALAAEAHAYYREHLAELPSLSDFLAYMRSDPKRGRRMKEQVDLWNRSESVLTRNLAQQLAYLKYCLSSGLQGALGGTAFVNYGRSEQDPLLRLVIPYERANLPKENTLYRRPWKTLLMTNQFNSQAWRDAQQTAELIAFLQGVDPASKEREMLDAAKTVWGTAYQDIDVGDAAAVQTLTEQLDLARTDPERNAAARLLIGTYLKQCVFPVQLKLDPAQLIATPQYLATLTSCTNAMGGTFGFEATWNPRLRRRPDHSSDEQILRALHEPRNQACYPLPSGGATAFMEQATSAFLSQFIAFIDIGTLFKGYSNEEVASFFLRKLPGHDAVLFMDTSCKGGAHLAVMTRSGKTVFEHSDKKRVKQALERMRISRPFAYYDQARCLGLDLELLRGRALVSFSDKTTQEDLLQAVMRPRNLLDGRHSVAFAVSEEMGSGWNGDKVIEVSKLQQEQQEEKAYFQAACEQLRGAVQALVNRKHRSIADREKRHAFFVQARSIMLEVQQNDLVEAFGSLQEMVPVEVAFNNLCRSLNQFAARVVPESKDAIAGSLQAILQWHRERGTRFPKRVREGEEFEESVQEVDLSKDQDRMRLMEEEYERMLGLREPKPEVEWTKLKRKWVRPFRLGALAPYPTMPTLHRLGEAVAERGYSVPFASRLLLSVNLLSTFRGQANCLLTQHQKPVHRCLAVRGDRGMWKLVLLTEGDANLLRSLLVKAPAAKGRDMFLVETSGVVNQRGDRSQPIENLWKEGEPSLRMLLFQAMVFQGAALALMQIPIDELREVMYAWAKGGEDHLRSIRGVFETALNFRDEDMAAYHRSRDLKALFRLREQSAVCSSARAG